MELNLNRQKVDNSQLIQDSVEISTLFHPFPLCMVMPLLLYVNKWLYFILNPLNPAGRFSGLRKQGPRNPAGRFSGICYGVSKTRRAFKPAHVRLIIKWFVYTGRYQATLRSQVESSSLFSFRTICNLLTGFCTWYMNLRRKYGGDTQCMWRYRYSLHVIDNVEE